jgi:hypothetical protein
MALKEGEQIIAQNKLEVRMDISHQKGNIYCLYGHVYIRHPPVEKIGI